MLEVKLRIHWFEDEDEKHFSLTDQTDQFHEQTFCHVIDF